ncbi:MAG: glycosyltransferase [Rhizorhabdus sp.]
MGGMEAHCHLLVRALMAHGHEATLFASGDSDASLPLRSCTARHYEAVLPWDRWHGTEELQAFQNEAFSGAWADIRREGFDVVHNNSMHPALHDWAERDRQPMVTSLHVPPFPALASAVARNPAPGLRQTTTSQAHRTSWWSAPPASASVVYNGIDAAAWAFNPRGNGRAIWVGRITPNKGTHLAIDAAQTAGLPLDLIGPVDCMDYHMRDVVPRLGPTCVYHGLMETAALASAMRAASVMLMTPTWDEPFGLVAAEAMACGVPVAALDKGAMREVIGDTGALATHPDELPVAIMRAMALPREACRARVEQLFSVGGMIAGYEAAYAAAVSAADEARASSSASSVAVLA